MIQLSFYRFFPLQIAACISVTKIFHRGRKKNKCKADHLQGPSIKVRWPHTKLFPTSSVSSAAAILWLPQLYPHKAVLCRAVLSWGALHLLTTSSFNNNTKNKTKTPLQLPPSPHSTGGGGDVYMHLPYTKRKKRKRTHHKINEILGEASKRAWK